MSRIVLVVALALCAAVVSGVRTHARAHGGGPELTRAALCRSARCSRRRSR
jgi:hypothetical protein